MDVEHLKFPIGRFVCLTEILKSDIVSATTYLGQFPELLRKVALSLNENDLETPYRPGGWTLRQLIHHIADSHMNALIRFKLALTEKNPIIKPYPEAEWAKLADSSLPIDVSLNLIDGIHLRLTYLIQNMSSEDFEKCYFHPESAELVPLKETILMYRWHAEHHLAHLHLIKF